MDFVLLRVFPAVLMSGGLLLAYLELQAWGQERTQEHPRRVRFWRRLTGALVLCLVAVLVTTGEIPHRHLAPDQIWAHFQHWLYVLGGVLVLMCLAVWDVLDGVRHLRGYLDGVEREEIRKIREALCERQATGVDPPAADC